MRQAWTSTASYGVHRDAVLPNQKGFLVSTDQHVLDELKWRGLIAHSTDLDALRAELSDGMVKLYCGFDPTAPSLHMGNLLQILTLRRFQDAGQSRTAWSAARPG